MGKNAKAVKMNKVVFSMQKDIYMQWRSAVNGKKVLNPHRLSLPPHYHRLPYKNFKKKLIKCSAVINN